MRTGRQPGTTKQGTEIGHEVRFAAPSLPLAPYLAGYHSYDIRLPPEVTHEEIFLPAWANIRVQVGGTTWSMRIGDETTDPIPRLSLFGPTSQAGFATIRTGHIIGVALTPRGWARLIGGDAGIYADRIVDLPAVLGPDAHALGETVLAAHDFEGRVAAFEALLLRRLARSRPEPPEIAAIHDLLTDPEIGSVEEAHSRLPMPGWKFARLSRRHFGFPPKLLIRRARFVRTLMRIREEQERPWAELLDPAYHDQSHFIRDCRDFLGMTPSQFVARHQPVAKTSMAERKRVLGEPVQALHRDDDPAQDRECG